MQCHLCLLLLNDENNGRHLFDNTKQSKVFQSIIQILHLEINPNDDAAQVMICQSCWQHLDDFYIFCKYVEQQQNRLAIECAVVKTEPDTEEAPLDVNLCPAIAAEMIEASDPIDTNEQTLDDMKDIFMEDVKSNLHKEHNEDKEQDVDNASQDDLPLEILFKIKQNKKKPKSKIRSTLTTKKSKSNTLTKRKAKSRTKQTFKSDDKKTEEMQTIKEADPSNEHANDDTDKEDELRKCEAFLITNMLLKCEICEESIATFALLLEHFQIKHNCIGYLKCCKRVIKTRTFLIDHISHHLNPKKYECKECHTYFKSRYNLNGHIVKSHPKTEQLKYKCNICEKAFALSSDLDRHVVQHQTERNCICQICNKGFTNKYGLAIHVKIIHETASFICNHCGKEYKDRQCFEDHVAKHEGNYKPNYVQCSQCGIWLKHKDTLRKHMQLHNPIDIECKLCGRICHTRRAYLAHMRYLHTNKQPAFSCTFCDKTFKRKSNYEEHLAMHTGEKHNTCPHCPKEFRSKANMYAHIKRDHADEWVQSKLSKVQDVEKLVANSASTAT